MQTRTFVSTHASDRFSGRLFSAGDIAEINMFPPHVPIPVGDVFPAHSFNENVALQQPGLLQQSQFPSTFCGSGAYFPVPGLVFQFLAENRKIRKGSHRLPFWCRLQLFIVFAPHHVLYFPESTTLHLKKICVL